MSRHELKVRSAQQVQSTPLDITAEQISRLVDDFYGKVRRDSRLGPIFDQAIAERWPIHLERMKGFWRSVLLKTGEYHGRPVPVHMAIPGLQTNDFRIWLGLFEETASEIFISETATHVIIAARRIARSLWMARFASPLDETPHWLK